jgi:hypothetical protein
MLWPIPISTSGTHSVKANAHYSVNLSVSISTSGTCPTTTTSYYWGTLTSGWCANYAAANFAGIWWVQDMTNGSTIGLSGNLTAAFGVPFYVEDFQTIYWGCYNPTYGSACFSSNSTLATPFTSISVPTGSVNSPIWSNGTFDKTHSYDFVWEGATWVSTDTVGWTSASSLARENFATGGNGVWFTSIVVH